MIKRLRAFAHRIAAWFRRFITKHETADSEDVAVDSTNVDGGRKRRNIQEAMDSMSRTLELLNNVHKPTGLLDAHSHLDMEAFLATVGPVYSPEADEYGARQWPDYFSLARMPGIGAVVLKPGRAKSRNDDDIIYPDFLGWIVHENKRYPTVELARKREAVVELTMMYSLERSIRKRPNRVWCNLIIAVDRHTGDGRALKVLHRMPTPGGRYSQPRWEYQIDPGTMQRADGADIVHRLFWAMNCWCMRDFGWQVRMSKGRRILTFPIPNNDARHWFRKRLTVTTESGRRRKILHEVVAHKRTTAKGETNVRTHLRGERQFIWNGCHTKILISPHDSKMLSSFTGEATDNGGISMYEAGRVLTTADDAKTPVRDNSEATL